MFACDGSVTTLCACALLKTMPRCASESIKGVFTVGLPAKPAASARHVSIVMRMTSRTSGRGSTGATAVSFVQAVRGSSRAAASAANVSRSMRWKSALSSRARATDLGDGWYESADWCHPHPRSLAHARDDMWSLLNLERYGHAVLDVAPLLPDE